MFFVNKLAHGHPAYLLHSIQWRLRQWTTLDRGDQTQPHGTHSNPSHCGVLETPLLQTETLKRQLTKEASVKLELIPISPSEPTSGWQKLQLLNHYAKISSSLRTHSNTISPKAVEPCYWTILNQTQLDSFYLTQLVVIYNRYFD